MSLLKSLLLSLIPILLLGCDSNNVNSQTFVKSYFNESINSENNLETLSSVGKITLPSNYKRIPAPEKSFGNYLRSFPIADDQIVHLYNGEEKRNQNAQYAVLKIDVGNRDLQQCADAVMRLRAEYLFQNKRYDKIAFNFTSGDEASFSQYAKGYRAVINGNNVSWVKKGKEDYSYKNFRKYMNLVFSYAGTHSLSKELKNIDNLEDINIGDVFIKGGFPGHAVIVMDVAKHKTSGKKIFLLAQSYMPAQDIHILKNPNSTALNPWYSADFKDKLYTPEWTFDKNQLKRW